MMGKVTNPKNENLKDLSAREMAIMLPLILFIFWIGVYPNTFLDKMNPAVENLVEQVKAKQQIAMMVEDMDQTVTQITVND
jgi:NADH-quinone oxidoreductase subunit M